MSKEFKIDNAFPLQSSIFINFPRKKEKLEKNKNYWNLWKEWKSMVIGGR